MELNMLIAFMTLSAIKVMLSIWDLCFEMGLDLQLSLAPFQLY